MKFTCYSRVHMDFSLGCTGQLVPPPKFVAASLRLLFHFHLATSSDTMRNGGKPALPFSFSVEWAETMAKQLLQRHESHSRALAAAKSEGARVRGPDLETRRERGARERRRAETRGEVSRRRGEKVNGCARPSASQASHPARHRGETAA